LLLGLNDTLFKRLGPSISNVLPPAAEDDFQEAAGALSRKRAKKQEYHEPPPGPIPLPEQRKRANGSGYVRDPAVSGAAIARSGYLCALDGSHRSFISRTTEQNFVEAHHLLPMQFQQEFTASLDVVENIAVLCPTCHRMLHHGTSNDKKKAIERLYRKHAELLDSRGIGIPLDRLLQFYHGELSEE
jgi:5-methylcytosine-specific restriction protein A